jgi:hypothetical protein
MPALIVTDLSVRTLNRITPYVCLRRPVDPWCRRPLPVVDAMMAPFFLVRKGVVEEDPDRTNAMPRQQPARAGGHAARTSCMPCQCHASCKKRTPASVTTCSGLDVRTFRRRISAGSGPVSSLVWSFTASAHSGEARA